MAQQSAEELKQVLKGHHEYRNREYVTAEPTDTEYPRVMHLKDLK